jgi:allophanate hydrolase subunit 1
LVGAATGVVFTVTDVVYTVEGAQPGCEDPSLTVSEYTDVAVGIAVGFAVLDPESADPFHTNVLAPPVALDDKTTTPPIHIGPLFVGAATGVLFTVTDVVYTVDGAQPASVVPSLTVSEYTVVDVGVAVGFSVFEPVNDEPVHT